MHQRLSTTINCQFLYTQDSCTGSASCLATGVRYNASGYSSQNGTHENQAWESHLKQSCRTSSCLCQSLDQQPLETQRNIWSHRQPFERCTQHASTHKHRCLALHCTCPTWI